MQSRGGGRASPRTLEVAIAAAATLLYVALTIHFALAAPALWRDEVNSVNTQAIVSWPEMWAKTQFDSYPLLWMLLLRGWMAMGGVSDPWLRLLGCLCSLTLPAALWFAARRLGRTVPLVALSLLAVNPQVVRWAGSVRAWGLGAALAIVSLVFIKEATDTPTRRRIALAVVAAVLSVQCTYQNAVLLSAAIAGCLTVVAWERRWRHAGVPIGIGVVAAISLLPYWPVMASRAEWNALAAAPVTLPYLARQFARGVVAPGPVVTAAWGVIGLGAVLALAIRVRATALFLLVTTGASGAALLLFYRLFGYYPEPWYFLALTGVAAIGLELTAASMPSTLTPMLRVGVAAGVLATGAPVAWQALGEPVTNMHLVGARLTAAAVSGDLIVMHPWEWSVSLSRYYSGDAEVLSVPPLGDMTVHRYDLVKAAMLHGDPLGPLLTRIQATLQSGRTVWYSGNLTALPPGPPPRLPGPPPLPESGWRTGPYDAVWSQTIGAFMRDHAVTISAVTLEGRGGRLEDVAMVTLRGWK
jgi:hypothetical protein